MDKPMPSLNVIRLVAAVATVIAGFSANAIAGPLEEANKKVVLDFYRMSFKDHEPKKAADLYIGDVYIQHNPRVPNGAAPFYGYFGKFFKENPTASSEVKRVIAEGDLVVLHSHSKANARDPGRAIIDIFRVDDGKIVEHWDVMQAVPTEPAPNGNTMFEGSNAK